VTKEHDYSPAAIRIQIHRQLVEMEINSSWWMAAGEQLKWLQLLNGTSCWCHFSCHPPAEMAPSAGGWQQLKWQLVD